MTSTALQTAFFLVSTAGATAGAINWLFLTFFILPTADTVTKAAYFKRRRLRSLFFAFLCLVVGGAGAALSKTLA